MSCISCEWREVSKWSQDFTRKLQLLRSGEPTYPWVDSEKRALGKRQGWTAFPARGPARKIALDTTGMSPAAEESLMGTCQRGGTRRRTCFIVPSNCKLLPQVCKAPGGVPRHPLCCSWMRGAKPCTLTLAMTCTLLAVCPWNRVLNLLSFHSIYI